MGAFLKVWYILIFILFILWELVVSSIRVAIEVLRPSLKIKPGVVAVSILGDTEVEITVLANLITLTPGSLTLDVSSDKKVLFVHSVYADNPESLRKYIKANLEKRVLRII